MNPYFNHLILLSFPECNLFIFDLCLITTNVASNKITIGYQISNSNAKKGDFLKKGINARVADIKKTTIDDKETYLEHFKIITYINRVIR